MKRYLILYFLLTSLLYILGACSLKTHKGFDKIPHSSTGDFRILDQKFDKILFQTSIDVYGKHLSGLMFIKDMVPVNAYRVVFLSETGMSFFDFEFPKSNGGEFKVYYCMDLLDKKFILKTLRLDIELLLMTGFDYSKFHSFNDKNREFYIRKYKDGRERRYYFKEISSNHITKVERSGLIFNKVKVELSEYISESPSKIKITHRDIKLNLELTKVTEDNNAD